jgi:acyl-CoA synthetase (AMP-forming)/AMP-acid ligase II
VSTFDGVMVSRDDDGTALVEAGTGTSLSYAKLSTLVRRRTNDLSKYSERLVFVGASNTIDFVVDYLALLEVDATIALLDPNSTGRTLETWIHAYRPYACWGFANVPDAKDGGDDAKSTRESVLLATSGSTGNPKFVRLSFDNVITNADQIVEALRIDATQRAMAHLPLYYSYGLSILNSHLRAGSTVVLCSLSALQAEFWTALQELKVTTLPGVPFSYDLYLRMGLLTMDLPALRHITQAGGRLATERILSIHDALAPRGVGLWVMYGQTEATARMSVLPPEALPEHAGSVGFPVPGASLSIENAPLGQTGEIVFRGGNVMLGYSVRREDVNGSDEQRGVLHTGDLGHLDEEGCLWIDGRSRRIAKVFGIRVNLDDVESQLTSWGTLAVIDNGERISLFLENKDAKGRTARAAEKVLSLPPQSVRLQLIETLPILASGKINYRALEDLTRE